MHEYDVALKNVLTRGTGSVLSILTGLEVTHWLSAELPEVRSMRADLLGETADGRLVHVEVQSTNDPRMALRMIEYSTAIYRSLRRFPEQMVLYVGQAPMRMGTGLEGPGLSFACRMLDIRDLDSEPLLESPSLEDNIIAVLTRLSDEIAAVRRILRKIAEREPERRPEAIAELMILAGLRNLGAIIGREMHQMPILDDIMDHDYLGPKIKGAMAEGERNIILSLIADRFGAIPSSVRQRIEVLGLPELEPLALRVYKVRTLDELFD